MSTLKLPSKDRRTFERLINNSMFNNNKYNENRKLKILNLYYKYFQK
ncbi:protein of unknown function [Methanocaldococcus lauensis]|nr:protein of unknown function [Methanocaldococcus lauensis]